VRCAPHLKASHAAQAYRAPGRRPNSFSLEADSYCYRPSGFLETSRKLAPLRAETGCGKMVGDPHSRVSCISRTCWNSPLATSIRRREELVDKEVPSGLFVRRRYPEGLTRDNYRVKISATRNGPTFPGAFARATWRGRSARTATSKPLLSVASIRLGISFSIHNAAAPPAVLVIDFYGAGSLALSVIDRNAAGSHGP